MLLATDARPHESPAPPASPLKRYIEVVVAVAPLGDRARRVDRLPDGRTSLVFRELDRGRGDVTVIGPLTRARFKDAKRFTRAVSFQFKPGWSTPFLGVGAHELTDKYVDIETLWRGAGLQLVDELLHARSLHEMVELVSRALSVRLARASEPASAPLARRAARLLENEDLRVEGVAARLGITARHLRRAFAENIGVTPRDFARGARLQRAVRLSSTSTNWLRVALEAGYCDQPHLNADFRDLVGLTPIAFAKRASETDPAPTSD